MIGRLIGLIIGAGVLLAVIKELILVLRRLSRSVRVPGVYVATRDARGELGKGPNTHTRAAYFRFTTADGRTVTVESRVLTFPGPRIGRRCTVLYDPRDPEKAETTGRVAAILLCFLPLGVLLGGGCVVLNLADLG